MATVSSCRLYFRGIAQVYEPNCSLLMYVGDGGVTFLGGIPPSLDLPRSNMSANRHLLTLLFFSFSLIEVGEIAGPSFSG